ncbi:thioredoxin reductase (NADPH) [Chitinophaga costaii]|uniref:Thioredoxin reductase (NADPH) n=1 Tax=Chitinophaga costaii TaxID=1335309 RepID=A0A1C4DA03_9BACT|nr:YpdA family putative bacillithiol disulfide reductase [Chitinophaga costaii]PUZ24523.1 YpdA family putative bacillithiol disulfide reductase [Chitinophaga costaii]SCC28106.1 thioredoxin reductase (NADPH) [Chitinophaga costaii]
MEQTTFAYDVLIIGAGPIGLATALAAQQANLKYVVIEKGTLVNSLYNYPVHMTFFSTSERLEIGGIPFVSINRRPSRLEAMEYYRRVATAHKLHVNLFEKVEKVTTNGNGYTVITEKATYTATHVVIATGFFDIENRLDIPGEDLPKVTHYYKEPHFYTMQHVVVVGANNSSVDAALETYRKGAHVTMVIRDGEIGSRVKYWVRPDMENRIKEGSVKVYFHSSLTAIRPDSVDIQTPDGLVTIPNDYVLAMTGYRPDLPFLADTGIEIAPASNQCPTYNPDTMETNLPNLYLAGVVCGGLDTHVWFIENSREHAEKIVAKIVRERAGKQEAPQKGDS